MIHLSIAGLAILQMIVASVLPTIVALVTNRLASSEVKTLTLVVLAALTDVLTSLVGQADFDIKQVVLSFFGILFAAVAAHVGVTSNINLSGKNSAPALAVPGGIGNAVQPDTPVSD